MVQSSTKQTQATGLLPALGRVGVLVPYPLETVYTYAVPDGLSLAAGDYVTVPLGRRDTWGVVWENNTVDAAVDETRLKAVVERLDVPPMPGVMRQFVDWVARYTLSDRGSVLKMCLSVPKALAPPKKVKDFPGRDFFPDQGKVTLSDLQQRAADALTAAVQSKKFSVSLLDGVTGAGKTEVYFEAIAKAVVQGRQVLVLLPEISLSQQFLENFNRRFGGMPAVWHSEVSEGVKRLTWRGVALGETKVVVGARSALFLPFDNLGLIIVDEEHDQSYKQEEGVIYHARDMAIVRAKLADIPVVLVSATPSLETLINARDGKYAHLELPSRYGGAQMPSISIVDLKSSRPQRQRFLSQALRQALLETFESSEQSLLFLNRRGYAPLTLCRSCGHRFQCPSCTAWLVEHKRHAKLMCHHCGYAVKVPPECPACHEKDSLAACGPGIERIEEEIREVLPEARTLMLASDVTNSVPALRDAIGRIERREIDVIIGTQIIAKGHHFPSLTCVGIVDADLGLAGGDLRASEKTFQLLHQVSGRAGRGLSPGRVFIQTYMPEHRVIEALREGRRDAFMAIEAQEREEAAMPPFGRLAALIVKGPDEGKLDALCRELARTAPRGDGVRVLGPAPAPMAILRGHHRKRFLIKAGRGVALQPLIEAWLARFTLPHDMQIKVDIDPQSFY